MIGVLNQVVSGIATGGIYASIALALVMIFLATHQINFAQGEIAMFSTYIALMLIQAGVPYWIAFLLTVTISFTMGMLLQRFVLEPLSNAPILASVGAFLGLLLIFNNIAGWIFGYSLKPFPTPFGAGEPMFGGMISRHEMGSTVVTLAVLVAIWAFFRFTKVGLAMRAAAYNPVSSRLVGIPVARMLALGWGLAAGIGAIAGMMVAPIVFLDPNMMAGVLLYAFAAALLGGITSPLGAVVGGVLMGVIENLAGAYVVGTELKLTTALVIIVVVLVFKPSGLFGKALASRV
ncbi:MAG: branched-chain amino acid ABC transporter permease [Alphaproteobacteria bacterium]|nr:branched-chain amino acid ABC transporter permease [Alphaproteobacteria bacterium]